MSREGTRVLPKVIHIQGVSLGHCYFNVKYVYMNRMLMFGWWPLQRALIILECLALNWPWALLRLQREGPLSPSCCILFLSLYPASIGPHQVAQAGLELNSMAQCSPWLGTLLPQSPELCYQAWQYCQTLVWKLTMTVTSSEGDFYKYKNGACEMVLQNKMLAAESDSEFGSLDHMVGGKNGLPWTYLWLPHALHETQNLTNIHTNKYMK